MTFKIEMRENKIINYQQTAWYKEREENVIRT